MHQSVEETVEHGKTFLARTVRQRWEDTLGARSDVSLAHDCDTRST